MLMGRVVLGYCFLVYLLVVSVVCYGICGVGFGGLWLYCCFVFFSVYVVFG